MTDRELMQQVLDALEKIAAYRPLTFAECSDAEAVMGIAEEAIPALRERLAQPEQEPVAHVYLFEPNGRPRVAWDNAKDIKIGDKLYTAPPQRKPLTHPQIHEFDWPDGVSFEEILLFVRAVEAAHGIKVKA